MSQLIYNEWCYKNLLTLEDDFLIVSPRQIDGLVIRERKQHIDEDGSTMLTCHLGRLTNLL